MSPIHDQALEVAGTLLRRKRGLSALSPRERREVEELATAIALRIADTLERIDCYSPHARAPARSIRA